MRNLISDGIRWIFSQQRDNGSWSPETPPYGGEGEIVHPAYFTALALRSVIAYLKTTLGTATSIQSGCAQARIAQLEAGLLEERAVAARHLAASKRWRAGTITLIATIGICGASLAVYSFEDVLVSDWSRVTGFGVLVVAAIIVLAFDLLSYATKLAKWTRKKLRGSEN